MRLRRAERPPAKRRDVGQGPRAPGLADVSKAPILRVLDETQWVIAGPSGAAAKLEMKRTTLNFRMKKLGIGRPSEHGFE